MLAHGRSMEQSESVLVFTRKTGFTRSAQHPKKALKICIAEAYNFSNAHEDESLSAYVQDRISNKKPVWMPQFHVSSADYYVLNSLIMSGAKLVSRGWNFFLPNTTQ